MIYDNDTSELLNKIDEIIDCIMNLNEVEEYISNKIKLNHSEDVILLTHLFNEKKRQFEKIKTYGKYSPDFSVIQKELYGAKRSLDMNELVSNYRISEMDLQHILDEVCEVIARNFSTEVIVSSGTVFSKNEKCGGNCH